MGAHSGSLVDDVLTRTGSDGMGGIRGGRVGENFYIRV